MREGGRESERDVRKAEGTAVDNVVDKAAEPMW
jgi:hypothetical protein